MNRSMSELTISDTSDYGSEYVSDYVDYTTSDFGSDNEKKDVKKSDLGRTELHAAAELNDLPLVKKLLSQGVHINVNDRSHLTPLHLAAKSNVDESHFELIKFLLKKGASVKARDDKECTPLFYLVEKCNKRMLQLFMDFKAKVHVKNRRNESLLFSAVRNTENIEVMQKLIVLGLSVNHHDKAGDTPLITLLEPKIDYEKYSKMIELLLDNGAINNASRYGKSLLEYAIEQDNFKMFQLLLDKNADVHVTDRRKKNLFHITVRCNANHNFLQSLVDRGLNINHRDNYGKTPLHEAAIENKGLSHFSVIEFILKNGAKVNVKDKDGLTPLWYLVQDGHFKIVELFLNFKPNLNVVDDRGFNLLFQTLTWRNDNCEVLQLLLNQGLNVNHRSEGETTPLHEAASRNIGNSHLKVSKILLQNKADVNAVDIKGRTPLQYLMRGCHIEIFQLFTSYQADVHVVDHEERNLLFYAIENPIVLLLLIDLGLDVNCCSNNSKRTPLHLACAREETISFKFLVKHCSNLNAVDSDGFTPLMWTVRRYFSMGATDKFDTMVESTDFNNTESDFNHEYFDNEASNFCLRNCFCLIAKHLAILQTLDVPVKPDFLDTILVKKKCDSFFKKCLDELSRAKSTKLKNSWITYYDLLVGTKKKLKNYAGNEDLIEDFQKCDFEEKFPIYGSKMEENVERGIERRKLFDKSTILLSDCLPIFNQNHLIIRDIFDCRLSKRDLLQFCI